MTERSVAHGSFTIERRLGAPPARVFAAWADPEAKAQWFAAPAEACTELVREMNFRVGGQDRLSGKWKESGVTSHFHSYYWDIIPNERIVYAYEMHLDERKISVSLATIEFRASGGGTLMTLTEHGAFLDGYDDNHGREHGTRLLVGNMAKFVDGEGDDPEGWRKIHGPKAT
ncbi:MAG TPA: SRPBCC family protein [Caulobacterales bacterium]|nr:SRPBCC family protein [Caulobacterales bacterium]